MLPAIHIDATKVLLPLPLGPIIIFKVGERLNSVYEYVVKFHTLTFLINPGLNFDGSKTFLLLEADPLLSDDITETKLIEYAIDIDYVCMCRIRFVTVEQTSSGGKKKIKLSNAHNKSSHGKLTDAFRDSLDPSIVTVVTPFLIRIIIIIETAY